MQLTPILFLDDAFKVSPPQPNLRLLVQTSTLKLPSMDPLVQCSIADRQFDTDLLKLSHSLMMN